MKKFFFYISPVFPFPFPLRDFCRFFERPAKILDVSSQIRCEIEDRNNDTIKATISRNGGNTYLRGLARKSWWKRQRLFLSIRNTICTSSSWIRSLPAGFAAKHVNRMVFFIYLAFHFLTQVSEQESKKKEFFFLAMASHFSPFPSSYQFWV